MKYTLLFLSTCLCLLGCQPDKNTLPTMKLSDKSTSRGPSECDKLKSDLNSDTHALIMPPLTVQFEREYQRIIRHNCNGQVASDKVETVKSPTANFDLPNPTKRPYKAVLVMNASNCTHRLQDMPLSNFSTLGLSAVTGDDVKGISIKGDLSPGWLTFGMQKGDNQMIVRFYHNCSPYEKDCQTPGTQDFTTVQYPVTASFHEDTLPDTKTINPSPESCARDAAAAAAAKK